MASLNRRLSLAHKSILLGALLGVGALISLKDSLPCTLPQHSIPQESYIVNQEASPKTNNAPRPVKLIEKDSLAVDYPALRAMITRHEGVRNQVYHDSKGILTIGVGFNLEQPGARREIESLGLDYTAVCRGRQSLSPKQIEQLMETSFKQAEQGAQNYLGKEAWTVLDGDAKEILVDMCYNLGERKLGQFSDLRKALVHRNYSKAAEEMRDSRWYNQVGNRSKELVNRMEHALDN